jgi:hypothetical protein
MKYFGTTYDAPVYANVAQVSTPVGERCISCNFKIVGGDDGFILPSSTTLTDDGKAVFHRQCFLAEVVGEGLAEEIVNNE